MYAVVVVVVGQVRSHPTIWSYLSQMWHDVLSVNVSMPFPFVEIMFVFGKVCETCCIKFNTGISSEGFMLTIKYPLDISVSISSLLGRKVRNEYGWVMDKSLRIYYFL